MQCCATEESAGWLEKVRDLGLLGYHYSFKITKTIVGWMTSYVCVCVCVCVCVFKSVILDKQNLNYYQIAVILATKPRRRPLV